MADEPEFGAEVGAITQVFARRSDPRDRADYDLMKEGAAIDVAYVDLGYLHFPEGGDPLRHIEWEAKVAGEKIGSSKGQDC
jgi:hypothetical protein